MAYDNIIKAATDAYNNTLKGYQDALAKQQAAQQGVIGGYNKLSEDTFSDLRNADAAQKQAIVDKYTSLSGQMQMGAINKGLGNTTVLNSLQRGLTSDQDKAQVELASRFAGLKADYRSRIGLAGLGYEGDALKSNLGFLGQGLEYAGKGAIDIAGIGINAERYKNEYDLARQKMAMDRLYGTGHGGGGSLAGPMGHGPNSPSPAGGGGGYDPNWYNRHPNAPIPPYYPMVQPELFGESASEDTPPGGGGYGGDYFDDSGSLGGGGYIGASQGGGGFYDPWAE